MFQNVLTLLIFSFFSMTIHAAALCPKNSCNPYNGCTEGCTVQTTIGSAVYIKETPQISKANAKKNAINYAAAKCNSEFFFVADWSYKIAIKDNDEIIFAENEFSCF